MLLGEPPSTQYDLHFEVAGVPVRVHPMFWLAGAILGAHGTGLELLIFVVCLFISILVHELGHSMMMRRFGMSSHIVLHMMGGLAIPDSFGMTSRGVNARQWILIAFAGPAAGFALAGLIVLVIVATGGAFQIHLADFPFFWRYGLNLPPGDNAEFTAAIDDFINIMLFINILWGLINLFPVYPLDGGQISRQIFTELDPWQGVVKSLWLSVFAGGGLAAYAVSTGNVFMALLFGMLAFQSYTGIQQSGGSGGGGFGGRRPW